MVQTQQIVYSKHVQFVYPLCLSKPVKNFSIGPTQTAAAAESLQSCATPQRAAHQAPLSLGFSRQEYQSGLPFPSAPHRLLIHKHFLYSPCISFFLPKCHRLNRDQGSGGPWHAKHDQCSMIFLKCLDAFRKVQKHLCCLFYQECFGPARFGLVSSPSMNHQAGPGEDHKDWKFPVIGKHKVQKNIIF